MDLYFLGTGAGLPSKARNVTSIALRLNQERNTFWLFDCGEATQHQMLHSPLRPTKLERIFVTHLHGDHIYGLPGLLGSRAFQHGEQPVTIYGPVGIRRFIETTLSVSQTHLPYSLVIHEIEEGVIANDDTFRVTCRQLQHGVMSFGFRVEEKPTAGKLQRDRLEREGVMKGPVYARVKAGEDITLADGRVIHGKDYVDSPAKGRTVVILGDTRPTTAAIELAQDADLLVHEGTYRAIDGSRAERHNHSTTIDAAEIAKRAGVNQLVMTHVSARYDEMQMDAYLAEAKDVFANAMVAHDHMQLSIPKHA